MFKFCSQYSCKSILCLFVSLICFSGIQAQTQNAADKFPVELDHIYVWVSKESPEAGILQKLGLYTNNEINKHTGQGTASVGFMFENAYLELIWVDDEKVVAENDKEKGTNLLERSRWEKSKGSPFGIGLRRISGNTDSLPFATQKYTADWMKPNTFIEIATSSSKLKEPEYFVVPDYIALPSPDKWKLIFEKNPEYKKLFAHPLGVKKLTVIKISADNRSRLSPAASSLIKAGVLKIDKDRKPKLELTFDGGLQGKMLDARPNLPIVLKY